MVHNVQSNGLSVEWWLYGFGGDLGLAISGIRRRISEKKQKRFINYTMYTMRNKTHKTCTQCQQSLPRTLEHFHRNGKHYFSSKCIPCHNEYNRSRNTSARKSFKEYKQNLSCIQCGFNDSRALVFHHRDPSTKSFTISDNITRQSKENMLNEIAKCDVLCANCHSIHHYDETK